MTRLFNGFRSSLRGWRMLAALGLVLAAVTILDRRLLDAAPLYGVRPADATWVLSTGDFPKFWRDLEAGDVFTRVQENWPRPQGELERAVRLATGIRPSPTRWRIWLGERFTVAQSPDGIGYSVYPGILLRAVAYVAQPLGFGVDESGVGEYNDIFYAWRDRFLVFSRDRAYVQACVQRGVQTTLRSGAGGDLAFHWFGDHEGYLRVSTGSALPVDGRVKLALTDGAVPLSLTNAWPSPPAAALTVRTWDDLRTVGSVADAALEQFQPWLESKAALRQAVHHWNLQPLPSDWDSRSTQFSLALRGAEVSGFIPIPDLALVMREDAPVTGNHPLRPIFDGQLAVDYEWQGEPGVYFPWLGENLSPCLGRYGHDYIATLNEPAMAALAGTLTAGPTTAPNVDTTLRVSWAPAAAIARDVVLNAASRGLWPGSSGAEVQEKVTPILDAIGTLGTLRMDGTVLADGWIELDGMLFEPDSSFED